jgi:hypothetical protein
MPVYAEQAARHQAALPSPKKRKTKRRYDQAVKEYLHLEAAVDNTLHLGDEDSNYYETYRRY